MTSHFRRRVFRTAVLWLVVFFAWAGSVPAQEKKFVYLTFDDGAEEGTGNVHAALAAKGVTGSFFITGHNTSVSALRRQRIKEASEAKYLLANHAFNHWHDPKFYREPSAGKSNAEWEADFKSTDALVREIVGNTQPAQMVFARLPGYNCWRLDGIAWDDGTRPTRVPDFLKAKYKIVGWDEEWHGATQNPPTLVESVDTMVTQIAAALNGTRSTRKAGKVVLLMHDRQFQGANKDKLVALIEALPKRVPNLSFRRIDTYLTD